MTALDLCRRIQKVCNGDIPGAPVPRITCRDGFEMSVQACKLTYCEPRRNDGPWFSVEVGFPSEREELLMPFIDGDGEPTANVYGFVPVEVVLQVIAKHGGSLDESCAHLPSATEGSEVDE